MMLATQRLMLTPVRATDLPDLAALKSDPRAYATMLGGVRTPTATQQELADDLAFWSRHNVGMWTARFRTGAYGRRDGAFAGIAGIAPRPDHRGLSLRFALHPGLHRTGLAREAAGATLQDALYRAGLPRIVAVARQDNTASRTVLGTIGMRLCEHFVRDGVPMVTYEAVGLSPRPDSKA